MTHADSLAIPSDVTTKAEFYAHVIETMKGKLPGPTSRLGKACFLSEDAAADSALHNPRRLPSNPESHPDWLSVALLAASGPNDPVQQNWLSQLSNAASLLYGSFENYEQGWGRQAGRRCNWSGTWQATVHSSSLCADAALSLAGFYLVPSLFSLATPPAPPPTHLLLGPFHGRTSFSNRPTQT